MGEAVRRHDRPCLSSLQARESVTQIEGNQGVPGGELRLPDDLPGEQYFADLTGSENIQQANLPV
jgi:hypothetical protein